MSGRPTQRRSERGMVLPSTVMFLSLVVVAVAAIVFLLTARPPAPSQAEAMLPQPTATPTSSPTSSPTTPTPTPKPKPEVNKKQTLVVVFNNSNIAGLAGSTATKAQEAGWNVVGSDNWYGTISASTVYYPPRLQEAAKLLAEDLNVSRLKPAIEPMQFDRLTVVLTGDYRAN